MRPEEITLAIFEKYTPAELTTTASEMAQAIADKETAETEKKMSDGVFSERIKTHAAKVSELAQRYNKGGETAQIGCKIRYDIPVAGKKSYVRMDTEEVVEVHDMELSEKQETIQFPLAQQVEEAGKNAKKKKKDEPPLEPNLPEPETNLPEPKAAAALTFKDIQVIARHIAKVEAGKRDDGIAGMAKLVAPQLFAQKTCIGPDGRLETIESAELAEQLAAAWLKLAVEEELKPPAAEEVTHICPYPGCIDFMGHEGSHRFPPNEAAPQLDTAAPQPQTEAPKPKRQRKTKLAGQDAILPDPRKSDDDARPGEPGVH